MTKIETNQPINPINLSRFLKKYKFTLPDGFLDFYKKSEGGYIYSERYIHIFKISDFILFNEIDEEWEEASNYLVFASDGGDMAYLIEKDTGHIYEIPFIGDLDELKLICKTFTEFIEKFPLTEI